MIRLIKKQQGLPFLLTLGVLFILSASFLAVQFWSEDLRGAAAALESPVMPPSINAPTVVPPPAEKPDKKLPAGKIVAKIQESPAEQAADAVEEAVFEEAVEESSTEAVESVVEAGESPVVKEVKKVPVSVTEKSVDKVVVKPVVEEKRIVAPTSGQKPEELKLASLQVEGDSPSEVVVKAVKTDKNESGKATAVKADSPARKAQKKASRRHQAAKSVETECPPEWNWFSTPLKVEMTDGKVAIVAAEKVNTVSNELTEKETSVVPEMKKTLNLEPAKRSVDKVSADGAKSVVKPFARAMGKMLQLKEKREKIATVQPVKHTEVVRGAAMTLKRIQDLLASMRENRSAGDNLVVSSEGVGINDNLAETQANQEKEIEAYVAKSPESLDYKGSGSGLSMRINDLIKSGAWLTD